MALRRRHGVLLCAAALATLGMAAAKPASAYGWHGHWGWHGGWYGPGVGIGFGYYPPPYAYAPPPVYYAPPPAYYAQQSYYYRSAYAAPPYTVTQRTTVHRHVTHKVKAKVQSCPVPQAKPTYSN